MGSAILEGAILEGSEAGCLCDIRLRLPALLANNGVGLAR